jgi:hypothetical protein
MDREELTALIKEGPVRIRVNDGAIREVPSPQCRVDWRSGDDTSATL